jgi:hypothetical protein
MRSLEHRRLTPEQELDVMVPVKQAADIRNVSVDTYKRRYGHTIEKVSERRNAVKLRNAINPPPAP